MKAFVFPNPEPLYPFSKVASEIRLKDGTLGARLRAQLKKAGFQVVELDSPEMSKVAAGSLIIRDDMLISDNFLDQLKSAIANRKKNYQCAIDFSRFQMFSPKDPAPCFRLLSIYYLGEKKSENQLEEIRWESLNIVPEVVHEIDQGIPSRMHNIEALRVYILDQYAIEVNFWFDLQTATSLYSREFVAKMVLPASKILPGFVMKKIMTTSWIMEKGNIIGKNCKIHPTAVLEGCIVGDNVEIGPFSYLRSSVLGDNVSLREKSAVKLSYLGRGAFVMGSDIVNCYIGDESSIFTPLLYNVVFGEKSFLSGGSGFADFNIGGGDISVTIKGKKVKTGLNFLGSCVGDNCFLGANLIFSAGQAIPDGTRILDNGLVKSVPVECNGTYIVSDNKCIQIPNSFLGAAIS